MTLAGLPHSEILGSQFGYQLPEAYRRFLRPSSAPGAKASTVCPYKLSHHPHTHTRTTRPPKRPDTTGETHEGVHGCESTALNKDTETKMLASTVQFSTTQEHPPAHPTPDPPRATRTRPDHPQQAVRPEHQHPATAVRGTSSPQQKQQHPPPPSHHHTVTPPSRGARHPGITPEHHTRTTAAPQHDRTTAQQPARSSRTQQRAKKPHTPHPVPTPRHPTSQNQQDTRRRTRSTRRATTN